MKNKKSLSALISLAAIVLVVGTLAYFSRDLLLKIDLRRQSMIQRSKKNLFQLISGHQVLKLIKKLQLKILETLILW